MSDSDGLIALQEQHSFWLSQVKIEIHERLDFEPHFDALFGDATIGPLRFRDLFAEVLSATDGGMAGWKLHNRPLKALNLASYFHEVVRSGVEGAWAECGVFRGFSSLLLCRIAQSLQPGFTGAGFHIFDSFEGVSPATSPDNFFVLTADAAGFTPQIGAASFKAPLELVSRNVGSRFPDVSLHKGWIPQVLDASDDRPWAFVHIDVDQYQSTYDSLAYFYPRMSAGGVIVNDDYGAPSYPGAMKAWNRYCAEHQLNFVILDTGQAILVKMDKSKRQPGQAGALTGGSDA